MSEGGAGPPPQVFVVDSQANYIPMPTNRKPKWVKEGHKFLLLLVGLTVLGLVIEGVLIYKVYQRTEAFSQCRLHPQCHNLSSLSGQQSAIVSSQVGSKGIESNEIPTILMKEEKRPFAHLLVASNLTGANNVVQWEEVGEAKTNKMKYENGRLIIEQEGYYYLYSKVEINAAKECEVIYHKILKETIAYGKPIDLMHSKSNRCWRSRSESTDASVGEDLRSSFLGGIYHLEKGDKIFVQVSKIEKLNPGSHENFMGAFMISQ